MKLNTRLATHVLQALALGTVLASAVSAGCGETSNLLPPFQFAETKPAALEIRSAASPMVAGTNAMMITATPVGMWNVQFIAQGNAGHTPSIPDGALIDFGYAQWHTDGTEIMNSGGHAASTGNFCMGVWARSGMFTYEVNHFALSYDAASGNLAAKVNIREQITMHPSGNQFSGTFTIDVYNPAGTQRVDHLAGTIVATRVTVDQTVP